VLKAQREKGIHPYGLLRRKPGEGEAKAGLTLSASRSVKPFIQWIVDKGVRSK